MKLNLEKLNYYQVKQLMKTSIHSESFETPAGGGDITPAPANRATSLDSSFLGEVAGVSAPPTSDDLPPEVSADEINLDEIFNIDLGNDDDSDDRAYPRSRRLICSASTDGKTTIHRFGDCGIVLTAEETREVYEFLANSARIWGSALL
jgi:hypothetical protein